MSETTDISSDEQEDLEVREPVPAPVDSDEQVQDLDVRDPVPAPVDSRDPVAEVEPEGADADAGRADDRTDPGGDADEPDHVDLEHEGDVAADYLEELLDIADLDGDLDMDVEGERAIVSIVGADLSQLVGPRGEVLDALQELTRLAVYRETGERSRLMLDISGHRADLRRQLVEIANAAVEKANQTGERQSLRAMTPFERKVVHDAVAAGGLTSQSEGVEPRRHVVVLPA